MKDLNDRTQELLAGFRESGFCTDCWVNLNEEDHEQKCPVSDVEAVAAFQTDDSWKREYRERSIRAALKADGVSGGELESMVSRLLAEVR